MLLRIALRVENYRRRTVNKRLPQLLYVSFRTERFENSRMSPLNLCNTVRPFSNCFLTHWSACWQKFLITYVLYSCVFRHANCIFNSDLPSILIYLLLMIVWESIVLVVLVISFTPTQYQVWCLYIKSICTQSPFVTHSSRHNGSNALFSRWPSSTTTLTTLTSQLSTAC